MLWFRYLKYKEIGLFPVESQCLDFMLTTELEFKSVKLSSEPPRRIQYNVYNVYNCIPPSIR